jgi:N-acyl homoserine lactone hydrolase
MWWLYAHDTIVERLHLTDVTPDPGLPWTRPTFPVFGYLIRHPNGPILVDTGVGLGNAFIDELYSPVHYSLDAALTQRGLGVEAVKAVASSHLHFDHCGQNSRFVEAPVVVQPAEVEAARTPLYTVPEWAEPPGVDLRVVDGDHELAPGVRVLLTPGHTPGHQAVVVDGDDGPTVIAGQAAWSVEAFEAGELGDDGWDQAAGRASIRRLRELRPARVVFAHDEREWWSR